MNSKNLTKRLITSIPLIFLLCLSFYYSYILIISLIIISLVSWIEFRGLIFKIFKKSYYKLLINLLSLIYLTIFSSQVFSGIMQEDFKISMLYLFSICIFSDIGGLIFGKIFKGKKLTKIGDLFISFLKRKAKVKDTGDILPGHGGLLDRIDGMLLAIPLGIIICKYLLSIL